MSAPTPASSDATERRLDAARGPIREYLAIRGEGSARERRLEGNVIAANEALIQSVIGDGGCEDALQEGRLAMLVALRNWDPALSSLSTWAMWGLRRAARSEIYFNTRGADGRRLARQAGGIWTTGGDARAAIDQEDLMLDAMTFARERSLVLRALDGIAAVNSTWAKRVEWWRLHFLGGVSWSAIAVSAGISRQAVTKRANRVTPELELGLAALQAGATIGHVEAPEAPAPVEQLSLLDSRPNHDDPEEQPIQTTVWARPVDAGARPKRRRRSGRRPEAMPTMEMEP
jgi:DNA-directed RNA polymerase specialized sigma24 family protein